jgi:hypothetical protein
MNSFISAVGLLGKGDDGAALLPVHFTAYGTRTRWRLGELVIRLRLGRVRLG